MIQLSYTITWTLHELLTNSYHLPYLISYFLLKTQIVPHSIFQPEIPESQGNTGCLTKAWKEKILYVFLLSVVLIPFFLMMWINTLIHTGCLRTGVLGTVFSGSVRKCKVEFSQGFFLVIYDILWVSYYFMALNLFQTKLIKFNWF